MNLANMKRSETTEQIGLINWARANEEYVPELRLLHHIPNEGIRTNGPVLKAAEAIKAAKKELPLEGTDPEVRRHIIDKLYTSLLYNTPWELLGETYCCRRLFYEYRKEFCYLIAVHMEIIEPEGGSRQQAPGK